MTTDLAEYIAAEVRAEIARQRLTQRKLAELLGVSQAQVSDRLRGRIEFRAAELEVLARALGVPITQFLPANTPLDLDPAIRSAVPDDGYGRERPERAA